VTVSASGIEGLRARARHLAPPWRADDAADPVRLLGGEVDLGVDAREIALVALSRLAPDGRTGWTTQREKGIGNM